MKESFQEIKMPLFWISAKFQLFKASWVSFPFSEKKPTVYDGLFWDEDLLWKSWHILREYQPNRKFRIRSSNWRKMCDNGDAGGVGVNRVRGKVHVHRLRWQRHCHISYEDILIVGADGFADLPSLPKLNNLSQNVIASLFASLIPTLFGNTF